MGIDNMQDNNTGKAFDAIDSMDTLIKGDLSELSVDIHGIKDNIKELFSLIDTKSDITAIQDKLTNVMQSLQVQRNKNKVSANAKLLLVKLSTYASQGLLKQEMLSPHTQTLINYLSSTDAEDLLSTDVQHKLLRTTNNTELEIKLSNDIIYGLLMKTADKSFLSEYVFYKFGNIADEDRDLFSGLPDDVIDRLLPLLDLRAVSMRTSKMHRTEETFCNKMRDKIILHLPSILSNVKTGDDGHLFGLLACRTYRENNTVRSTPLPMRNEDTALTIMKSIKDKKKAVTFIDAQISYADRYYPYNKETIAYWEAIKKNIGL